MELVMKKVEKVYDKYGFYIGDRVTVTKTVHVRRSAKTSKKTYTEAEHRDAQLRLAGALEKAFETGGDVRVSRSGVSIVPYVPNRNVLGY
jgi:hypothetical protein